MRNARWVVLALLLTGCTSNTTAEGRRQLHAGYQALDQKDYDGALAASEQFLREHPKEGPGTAEALYLEGRVYEQRATSDDAAGREAQSRMDLQTARGTYVHALSMPAEPKLAALIHAGVANVAYFQEDYPTAAQEWSVAYPQITQPDAKAWMMYRIGVCQQRLGLFEQADRIFATVRRDFPRSVPAERAAGHLGARAFYVQVGAFSDSANADKIVASLQSQGYHAMKTAAGAGRQEVRVGPAYNYADAKTLQSRLLGAYRGAIIEP